MQNMRRMLKAPMTLRMADGGALQIPTGPGMDRAGFLERNPQIMPSAAPAAPPAPGSAAPPGTAPGGAPSLLTPTSSLRPAAGTPGGENFGGSIAQMYGRMSASAPAAPTSSFTRQQNIDRASSGAFQSTFQPMAVPGLRDGGRLYHKGSPHGGRVEGPGDGTVDTVDAKYANGEYVLPTDTAQAIGYDKLDAIKDATHTPVAEQKGQTLRMADGGSAEMPRFMSPPRAASMLTGQQDLVTDAMITNARNPVGQPGPPDVRAANTAANNRLPPSPNTMVQGPAGVTAPGVKYPGTSLVPVSEPYPTSNGRSLQTTGPGRTFTPPTGGSIDPNTIYQGRPTSTAMTTSGGGRGLALTGDAGRAVPSMGPVTNPSFANGASDAAKAYQEARAGAAATGAAPTASATPTAAPSLKTGMAGQTGALAKTGYVAGRVANTVRALANSPAGRAAGGLGVIANFNDYKLNEPDVDSSPQGTGAALGRDLYDAWHDGDGKPVNAFAKKDGSNSYPQTVASLRKGLLETGMDLGSFAANTLDFVVPGKAPVSTAYDKFLRSQFGDQLAPDASTPGGAQAVAQSSKRETGVFGRPAGYDDPRRLDRDPARQNLGASRDFTDELNKVPDGLPAGLRPGVVFKTIDPKTGRTTYSGSNVGRGSDGLTQMVDGTGRDIKRIGTPNGNFVQSLGADGRPEGLATESGSANYRAQSRAEIDATMTNPDGSRWSANDNAIMAANLRDGVDAYRGTSRQPAKPEYINMYKAATERRGQDLTYDAAMTNARATSLKAQQDRFIADRTFMAGREDAARAEETAAQTRGFNANSNTRRDFMQFNKDGTTEDKAASAAAYDMVSQIFPGINSADEATRAKFMPDAKEMAGIFAKARTQDKVGWDALKVWQAKRPPLSGMPDAKGGTTEQVGFLDGLLTLNASSGDTLLQRKDGSTLNLGSLTSRQRELVEKAKTSGKWGN